MATQLALIALLKKLVVLLTALLSLQHPVHSTGLLGGVGTTTAQSSVQTTYVRTGTYDYLVNNITVTKAIYDNYPLKQGETKATREIIQTITQ